MNEPQTGDHRRSRLWLAADLVMLLAFAFSVVVQVNDPDPWLWLTVYGLAALACGLSLARRGHWIFPAGVGALAFGWSLTLATRVIGRVPFADMFGAFEMESVAIEESREMYGLLIVAGWMAVLAWRRRADRLPPEGEDRGWTPSSP